MNKYVPLSSSTHRYSHLPKWFNQELRHKINCYRTLLRKFRLGLSPGLSRKVFAARKLLDNIGGSCIFNVIIDNDNENARSSYITEALDKFA